MTTILLDRAMRKRKRILYGRLQDALRELETQLKQLETQLLEMEEVYAEVGNLKAMNDAAELRGQAERLIDYRLKTGETLESVITKFNHLPEDQL